MRRGGLFCRSVIRRPRESFGVHPRREVTRGVWVDVLSARLDSLRSKQLVDDKGRRCRAMAEHPYS